MNGSTDTSGTAEVLLQKRVGRATGAGFIRELALLIGRRDHPSDAPIRIAAALTVSLRKVNPTVTRVILAFTISGAALHVL